ncbi:amidase [Rhizobiaceae sp. 2RAB30]
MFAEYADFDGLGLAELVRVKAVKPEEILHAAWRAIDALNPRINAVVASMREIAERDIGRGLPSGRFQGVPIVLKDEYLFYAGFPCDFSSRLGRGTTMPYDSTLVKRYAAAGLVITAKTNLPEFGASVTTEPLAKGACNNPWDLGRTVGGSSGGSAAAVASGMVPVAYANDGAGSIRIPASCTGTFGMKPTRGRTPTGPADGEYWNGLVVQHAITRTVRDSAALLDVSEGWEPGSLYPAPPKPRPYLDEVTTPPGRLKIAFSTRSPSGTAVHPDCVAATEQAARLCAELGHEVIEDAPDYDGQQLADHIADLLAIHLAQGIDALSAHHGLPASESLIERAHYDLSEHGRGLSALDMLAALQHFGGLARQVAPFFERYDAWLTPTLGSPPVEHGHITTNDPDWRRYVERYFAFVPFTPLANATGAPSMTLPLHHGADGLPVGVMFTGRFGDEGTLFRLAGQMERASPWIGRKPPVSAWNI